MAVLTPPDGESGQSTTEFILVVPIILLICLGAVQIILLGVDRIVLENAAFDAVRGAAPSYPTSPAAARQLAASILRDRTAFLPLRKLSPGALEPAGPDLVIRVDARVEMLPLLKEPLVALGGDGSVSMRVAASVKTEPYIGE